MGKLSRLFHRDQFLSAGEIQTPPQPVRVLLAEEDALWRSCIAHSLRCDGYEVQEVNGEQLTALVRAVIDGGEQAQAIDLVVSDALSIDQFGTTALANLRKINWVMPIILIASDDNQQTEKRAKDIHANAVIWKPLTLEDIRFTIQHIIAPNRSTQRSL
jgi:CheY-like chemotaxis protein